MDLVWLKVPQWEIRDGFVHGFMGRRGGKSQGAYGSLNVSFRVGDNPELVKDNLCDLKKAVGLHDLRIVTMRQVHGHHIIDIGDKHLKEAGEADGMVSEEREIFLGVLTADCVPILFNVPERKLVAALHAGWRGTLAGITKKMVDHLRDRYDAEPAAIEVAMGPAIGPCCCEIGTDVSVPIVQKWGGMGERALQWRDGKSYLDLKHLNRLQLEEAGVNSEKIYQIGPCTSCALNDFFSYRRQSRKTGLQISFIGWL